MKVCSICGVALAATVCLLAGCRARSDAAPDGRPFAQAPAEIKQYWEVAVAADRTNDYVAAQELFYTLLRQQLTPEQRQAVNEASTALNNRMLKALQAGDPAATVALQELRRHPPNRPQ